MYIAFTWYRGYIAVAAVAGYRIAPYCGGRHAREQRGHVQRAHRSRNVRRPHVAPKDRLRSHRPMHTNRQPKKTETK